MPTRSLSLGTSIAAVLLGCARGPQVETVEPEAPPAMRMWIGPPTGTRREYPLVVNREAYVALFEIVPGRGVTMVYPRSSADTVPSKEHYADLSIQPGRAWYQSYPSGLEKYQQRHYYAVASAAPLRVSRLLKSFPAIRGVLGTTYASYSPYDVIERLTDYVVPKQPDEDWATYLLVK